MTVAHFFKISTIFLLMGCSPQHKSQTLLKSIQTTELHVSNGQQYTADRIVFLTFRMELQDSVKDSCTFTLVNIIYADGILNKTAYYEAVPAEHHKLYCEITDDAKKRVDLLVVQNPLQRVVEYSPDKVRLEKKLITSNSGNLHLRFQLTKEAKFLTIYKPQPDLKTVKKIYHAQI